MRYFLLLAALCFACDDGESSPTDTGPEPADSAPNDIGGPDSFDPDMESTDGPLPDVVDMGVVDPDGAIDTDGPVDPDDAGPDPDGALPDGDQPDSASDAAFADIDLPDVPLAGECMTAADCLDFRACRGGACVDNEVSGFAGEVILNEILVDGALDQDANDDGDIHPVDDEFLELVNVTDEFLALQGWMIVERDLQGIPRHIFGEDDAIAPGEALVVFGGGAPSDELESTPGASFVVVNAADPAFNNGLNLDDGGDTVRLLDAQGDEVLVFSYGEGCARPPCAAIPADRSLTRSPDLAGEFGPHPDVVMSPGTRTDGASF